MLISCATAGMDVNDSISTAAIAQSVEFRMAARPVLDGESPVALADVEIFGHVIAALSLHSIRSKPFDARSVPTFRFAQPELNPP